MCKEKYFSENKATNYIRCFLERDSTINSTCIKSGFENLDYVLEGGFYDGLYVFGSISSLGKTTFIMNIADQIASSGNDVLIFSLEMARTELMAKSISRLTFLKNHKKAKTCIGITSFSRYKNYSEGELSLIRESVLDYEKCYAPHIFILEGMGNIDTLRIENCIKKHIEYTEKKPIVIIDYLQIIAPHSTRTTDKQNTDYAVLNLKRLTRDFKIPILAISSFNRQNYSTEVNMEAFKESGAIEYSSDALFGLQATGAGTKNFDINLAKRKNPRAVQLKVLKNRRGKTGETINYEYYPLFNYFLEKGLESDEFDWEFKDDGKGGLGIDIRNT